MDKETAAPDWKSRYHYQVEENRVLTERNELLRKDLDRTITAWAKAEAESRYTTKLLDKLLSAKEFTITVKE